MDRSWMQEPTFSKKYVDGVATFMRFVREHFGHDINIRCPCINCLNVYIHSQDVVYDHLLIKGIMETYTKWNQHGESCNNEDNDHCYNGDNDGHHDDFGITIDEYEGQDEIHDMIEDAEGRSYINTTSDDYINNQGHSNMFVGQKRFKKMLEEAERELYPGCKKFSKLSFLVKLLHLKSYNHWSNKSFDMLLELLRDAFFPDQEILPKSYYEANNMLRALGLGYISIHACKYDCALFWGEYKDLQECPICSTSRWKINDGHGKKIPHKILRYFPLTPRLQRLYMSRKTASDCRWHKDKRYVEDGVMRHPADGKTWKDFDKEHEWFAQEPRSIRLGLATDGFNPFGNMSSTYSMWPVILVPYNLPPWLCMKQHFFMMSLLIPGPQAPGKDIDVYMQPLINELKELWSIGVQTFDASTKEYFKLHAAVLWTINDFPAYGNLSGWSTKGYMACPVCNKNTCSCRLRSKICYMGHRQYLDPNHRWRKSKKFDGKSELRLKPKELSSSDILQQLDNLPTLIPGKQSNNKKRKRTPQELNWVKKSILFELPYWKTLQLRHNLDVMHIEKNICENVLGTLLGIEGKTKDTYKARQDLMDMNIRKELWLQETGSKYVMPPACYTMSKQEIQSFYGFLKSIKFPDGYASNISRCLSSSSGKITSLKSHDYHILLQRLLPIGMRGMLSKDVCLTLIELGKFFEQLCSKTLKISVLECMERDIAKILCKMELIFPPAFFDVMVHLAIHLPREAMYGGPVHYRWMFPIERFLGTLKRYVRNKAYPEGSIAEAYVVNECLTFCSLYLGRIETIFNREERNDDGEVNIKGVLEIFSQKVRVFGAESYGYISTNEYAIACWYVLNNCEEVQPFLNEHKEELSHESNLNVEERHKEQFPLWFRRRNLGPHSYIMERIGVSFQEFTQESRVLLGTWSKL